MERPNRPTKQLLRAFVSAIRFGLDPCQHSVKHIPLIQPKPDPLLDGKRGGVVPAGIITAKRRGKK